MQPEEDEPAPTPHLRERSGTPRRTVVPAEPEPEVEPLRVPEPEPATMAERADRLPALPQKAPAPLFLSPRKKLGLAVSKVNAKLHAAHLLAQLDSFDKSQNAEDPWFVSHARVLFTDPARSVVNDKETSFEEAQQSKFMCISGLVLYQ